MDIQIADGLSFDIFKQVEITAPVVFTTAFDQYAVQAFKVSAVDYLLKPVDPKDLETALQKFENQRFKQQPLDIEALTKLIKKENYKDRFLVKTGQQLNFLPTADIAYFRSSDGLTQAHSFSGKKFFVEHTLEELEMLKQTKWKDVRQQRDILIQSVAWRVERCNRYLRLGLTPIDVALAWTSARRQVSSAVIGARTAAQLRVVLNSAKPLA
jgi:YesN/AraC family two-component response regulator